MTTATADNYTLRQVTEKGSTTWFDSREPKKGYYATFLGASLEEARQSQTLKTMVEMAEGVLKIQLEVGIENLADMNIREMNGWYYLWQAVDLHDAILLEIMFNGNALMEEGIID